MALFRHTITGIDNWTDMGRVRELSQRYPHVEWGILYTLDPRGRPRYPEWEQVKGFLRDAPDDMRIALHLCGQAARDTIRGEHFLGGHEGGLIEDGWRRTLSGTRERAIRDLLLQRRGSCRVQLNLRTDKLSERNLLDLERFLPEAAEDGVQVILQHNEANRLFCQTWLARGKASPAPPATPASPLPVQWLFDESGGSGLQPTRWLHPLPGVTCGYAGGLNPSTLSFELLRIQSASCGEPFWIDMESGVRDEDDHLDLGKVEQVLHTSQGFLEVKDG